jgi:hypothetical protein
MKLVVDESMSPQRSLIYRAGRRARPMFDRLIARSSLMRGRAYGRTMLWKIPSR